MTCTGLLHEMVHVNYINYFVGQYGRPIHIHIQSRNRPQPNNALFTLTFTFFVIVNCQFTKESDFMGVIYSLNTDDSSECFVHVGGLDLDGRLLGIRPSRLLGNTILARVSYGPAYPHARSSQANIQTIQKQY
jgi:hypothetical protein